MNPFGILGVRPGASPEEVAASYRELAKRWHPDRGGGSQAERRMAEINAAYDLLRSGTWQERAQHGGATRQPPPSPRRPRRPAGSWLEEPVRRALGPELLAVLHRDEDVALVTPVSVWASPQALLAVTGERLLWLLDDAVTGRVRSLAFDAIVDLEVRLSWPRRRRATLRVSRRNGRRPLAFGDLRPETAEAVVRHVRTRAAAP